MIIDIMSYLYVSLMLQRKYLTLSCRTNLFNLMYVLLVNYSFEREKSVAKEKRLQWHLHLYFTQNFY